MAEEALGSWLRCTLSYSLILCIPCPLAYDLVHSEVGLPTSVSPRPLCGGFNEKMPPMGSCAQVVALFGAEPSGGGA